MEYRAFKDKEECFNEMKKHQPVGWVKIKISGDYAFIHNVNDHDPIIIFGYDRYSYDDLFNHFTFTDDSPFGIKITK